MNRKGDVLGRMTGMNLSDCAKLIRNLESDPKSLQLH